MQNRRKFTDKVSKCRTIKSKAEDTKFVHIRKGRRKKKTGTKRGRTSGSSIRVFQTTLLPLYKNTHENLWKERTDDRIEEENIRSDQKDEITQMRSDRIGSKYKISYTIQYKSCERYRGHRKADSGAEQRIRDFFKKIPKTTWFIKEKYV